MQLLREAQAITSEFYSAFDVSLFASVLERLVTFTKSFLVDVIAIECRISDINAWASMWSALSGPGSASDAAHAGKERLAVDVLARGPSVWGPPRGVTLLGRPLGPLRCRAVHKLVGALGAEESAPGDRQHGGDGAGAAPVRPAWWGRQWLRSQGRRLPRPLVGLGRLWLG